MTTTQTLYLGDGSRLALGRMISGGLEAEVFEARVKGRPVAVKVFLTPDHPSFVGKPDGRALSEMARNRLAEHQLKLPGYSAITLPTGVITPIELVYDKSRMIAGYVMELLTGGYEGIRLFADPAFRKEHGITNATILPLLIDLHRIIREGHAAKVIFGDALSGNNVQSDGTELRIIDADSLETPGFPNGTHTREFIDPFLCRNDELVMAQPHSRDGDWYAFHVLAAWLLTLAHPTFDGIYVPDDEADEVERTHKGISIFHPSVRLSKAAIGPDRLPAALVSRMREVFEKGRRGEFPLDLLTDFTWTECTCGNSHGLDACNACGATAPGNKRTRQGVVQVTTLFSAPDDGNIVSVAAQGGKLLFAYAAEANIHRENGSPVLAGAMTRPDARVLLSGARTAVHDGQTLTVFGPDGSIVHKATDAAPGAATAGSNSHSIYWLRQDGGIMRIGRDGDNAQRLGLAYGPDLKMWVGEKFGIALWREVTGRIFVFDAENPGISGLELPPVPGNLVDIHCTFSSSFAWLMLTLQRGGRQYNYCYVLDRRGTILASAEVPSGDGSWLGSGIRIHAATGSTLYTPTPDGIVRVEIKRSGSGVQFTARDPHADSAPHVRDATRLLVTPDGMLAITPTTITRLINS